MGYSGFAFVGGGERGNITYIILDNHALSKLSDNKGFIKEIVK